MVTPKMRASAIDILSAVIALGLLIARRAFDWPQALSWVFMACLMALVLWRMTHRSPYSTPHSNLNLPSR